MKTKIYYSCENDQLLVVEDALLTSPVTETSFKTYKIYPYLFAGEEICLYDSRPTQLLNKKDFLFLGVL